MLGNGTDTDTNNRISASLIDLKQIKQKQFVTDQILFSKGGREHLGAYLQGKLVSHNFSTSTTDYPSWDLIKLLTPITVSYVWPLFLKLGTLIDLV